MRSVKIHERLKKEIFFYYSIRNLEFIFVQKENLSLNEYQLDPALYPTNWDKKNGEIYIEVSSAVNASESEEKVKKAIKNIFPDLELSLRNENLLIGKSTNVSVLFHFFKKIFEQEILDVARKCAIESNGSENRSMKVNETIFFLNKQVAFINKVNFSSINESPLGPIVVTIESQNMELFIDTYFPKFEWFIVQTK